MRFVRELVRSGGVGEVRPLHAEHTQRLPSAVNHRLNDPRLGGGALLDLGVYPVSFAHDILGQPTKVVAHGELMVTGADACVATVLEHRGGRVSTSFSSLRTPGRNAAVILGTEGRIEIGAVWFTPAVVTVYNADGDVVDGSGEAVSGRGMQYQASEVERLVTASETSSDLMSPDQSIEVMRTMDQIRAAIGVRYPDES